MNDSTRLLSIEVGADRIGVSTITLRRLAKAGAIKCVRVGRRVLIPQAEVERVIAEGCEMQIATVAPLPDMVPDPAIESVLQGGD